MRNPLKPRTLATILLVTTLLVVLDFGIRRTLPHYPYGRTHCCDKALHMALLQYAESHDGWFPRGEETPEASLNVFAVWYRSNSCVRNCSALARSCSC